MEVIPAPLTCQQKPIDRIRTRTCFIVDQRLDEDALQKALDQLIRHHWRKLGARLVPRPADKLLEYHIPETFAAGYTLFNWSSSKDEEVFRRSASILNVSPGNHVCFLADEAEVASFFMPSQWPTVHKAEEPLLYVHVTFSPTATAIATNLSHAVADQGGLAAIMKAWLGLVDGREPPPMIGYADDVLGELKPYSEWPQEEVYREGRMKVRTRFERFLVILGFIPNFITYKQETSSILFLSRSLVKTVRERHSKILEEKYGRSPGISDGDIITAILTKFSCIYQAKSRTICMSQAVNVRGRHPNLLDGKGDAWIHNGLHHATARFRLDSSISIGEIAYQNRQAINVALNERDMEIGVVVTREMVRRGQLIHSCEPWDTSYFVSNWCSIWRGLDFSCAVKGEKSGSVPSFLVLGRGNAPGVPKRFSASIMHGSEKGYYCDFAAPPQGMTFIKSYLEKDPMLENF